ncbi:MAG: hypothetical protein AAFY31_08080 [Pseudomonadota bacterium]
MSRAEPFLLAVIFVLFSGAYGALSWLAGGLYLDTHEGDSYHLLDVLTRMSRGETPHVDFVTPLGALAFWPMSWFMQFGVSAGMAMIYAQVLVAGALFPIVLYAAATRLPRGLAIYFGMLVLGLVLALSYGTATSGVGISMHYNRWAWSIAFVLLLVVFVPSRTAYRPFLEGVFVGLLVACLALLKVTYFVALAPVAALALWQMHKGRGVIAAVVSGLLIATIVTIQEGFAFWFAYLSDLRLVAGNDIRPFVGTTFDQILAGPSYIGGTLAAVAAALVIRVTQPTVTGIAAFLLVPGLLYITYQNFGNDPQWLMVLPVLVLALRPAPGTSTLFGIDAHRVAQFTALAAFVLIFPSLFNVMLSPIKHASFDKARFIPMLPEDAGHQDIFVRRDRAYMMTAQVFRDQEAGPWAPYEVEAGRAPVPVFEGVSFPFCQWQAGSRALLETLGAQLSDANLPEGSRLFTADLLAAYWFFATVRPPEGSAPWYYGQLTGLENTDYVMVPKCAFTAHGRNTILGELSQSNEMFTLVLDNELLALFRVDR